MTNLSSDNKTLNTQKLIDQVCASTLPDAGAEVYIGETCRAIAYQLDLLTTQLKSGVNPVICGSIASDLRSIANELCGKDTDKNRASCHRCTHLMVCKHFTTLNSISPCINDRLSTIFVDTLAEFVAASCQSFQSSSEHSE
jgi:hypothetical protein